MDLRKDDKYIRNTLQQKDDLEPIKSVPDYHIPNKRIIKEKEKPKSVLSKESATRKRSSKLMRSPTRKKSFLLPKSNF